MPSLKEHRLCRNMNLSNVLKELASRLTDRVVHRLLRSLDPHLEQQGESERETVKRNYQENLDLSVRVQGRRHRRNLQQIYFFVVDVEDFFAYLQAFDYKAALYSNTLHTLIRFEG